MAIATVRDTVAAARKGRSRLIPRHPSIDVRVSIMIPLVTLKFEFRRPGSSVTTVLRGQAKPLEIFRGNGGRLVVRNQGMTLAGLNGRVMSDRLPHREVLRQFGPEFPRRQRRWTPPDGDKDISFPRLRHTKVFRIKNRFRDLVRMCSQHSYKTSICAEASNLSDS